MAEWNAWDEYQSWAVAKAIYPDVGNNLSYTVLGLVGEAGEVAEKVKKKIRDGHIDEKETAKELGDVLWYIATAAHELGFALSEVVKMNHDKLDGREQRGVIGGSGDNR